MKRRRIHSDIKLLEAAGVLPPEYRNSIHRSQLWRYRKLSNKDFYGSDLTHEYDDDLTDHLRRYPLLKLLIRLVVLALDQVNFLLIKSTVQSKHLEEKTSEYLRTVWADVSRLLSESKTIEDDKIKCKTTLATPITLPSPATRRFVSQFNITEEQAKTVVKIDSG